MFHAFDKRLENVMVELDVFEGLLTDLELARGSHSRVQRLEFL